MAPPTTLMALPSPAPITVPATPKTEAATEALTAASTLASTWVSDRETFGGSGLAGWDAVSVSGPGG